MVTLAWIAGCWLIGIVFFVLLLRRAADRISDQYDRKHYDQDL